jgi:DNA-binding transcriptional ArsR family regulator
MEPVSPNVTELFRQLKHPVRLPILLALSQRDAGATELARHLDVSFDTVNHALHQLSDAGLVQIERVERVAGSNLSRRVYRGTRDDWPKLVGYLESFADRGGG